MRAATVADVMRRLLAEPRYEQYAVDALGWGMGAAQVAIPAACRQAAEQGLVTLTDRTPTGKTMMALTAAGRRWTDPGTTVPPKETEMNNPISAATAAAHTDDTRPALLEDVLLALHQDNAGRAGGPLPVAQVQALVPERAGEVCDALAAAAEHGLVTLDEEGDEPTATLTEQGRQWSPSDKLPPLRYVWTLHGELEVGTLADYAKAWAGLYYAGERDALSDTVRTWREWTNGYPVTVKQRGTDSEGNWIYYALYAAGEVHHVSIDANA